MNIDTIENGYVIDHITPRKALEIYSLLELDKLECQVALITSSTIGFDCLQTQLINK